MIDNTQELDEILERVYLFGMNGGLGYEKFDNELSPKGAKQAVIDWHNKQIGAELEALREEVKHEDLRTISQIITARIDKLKESK